MPFLVRSFLAATLVALSFAPASRADDPKSADAKPSYKVLLRERWKVGDVVTRIAKETFTRAVEAKKGDEPVQKLPAIERQTSYVVVTKCLEADADGYATKFLLYLTAWTIEAGPQKDSSLSGVQIEVTGLGAGRTWKVLTPDAKPSAAALDWVEQFYGKKGSGEATYNDLEPKGGIEVGNSWDGDARSIAKRLADRGVPVDVEKSKATCTLVSVEAATAHVLVRMSFPTTELRLPNGQNFPWKEGGVLELNLDLARPLAAGEFDAKIHRDQILQGVAEGSDGVAVTWEDLGRQDIEVRAGGKMPEVPVAPASTEGEKKEPAMDDAPK